MNTILFIFTFHFCGLQDLAFFITVLETLNQVNYKPDEADPGILNCFLVIKTNSI